jgi:hypothetical protein
MRSLLLELFYHSFIRGDAEDVTLAVCNNPPERRTSRPERRQEGLSRIPAATHDGRQAGRELGFAAKTTLAEGLVKVESRLRANRKSAV